MRRALSWCLAVAVCASILAALFAGESSAHPGLAGGGVCRVGQACTVGALTATSVTASGQVTTDAVNHTLATFTIADDGAGTAPATAVNVADGANIGIAYNDATNGSVGTISETGAVSGMVIYLHHRGTGGSVVFSDVNGQQEIGASACTLTLNDTASFIYANGAWHMLTCRDNT